MLSHFSRVRLCATPETTAHQAPPSLGFSRQEHWVGCHFLLQCMKVKSESEVAQSCPTLRNPMDCSLPGSSIHGIFQARVLEWGAIAFSKNHHSNVKLWGGLETCVIYVSNKERIFLIYKELLCINKKNQQSKRMQWDMWKGATCMGN